MGNNIEIYRDLKICFAELENNIQGFMANVKSYKTVKSLLGNYSLLTKSLIKNIDSDIEELRHNNFAVNEIESLINKLLEITSTATESVEAKVCDKIEAISEYYINLLNTEYRNNPNAKLRLYNEYLEAIDFHEHTVSNYVVAHAEAQRNNLIRKTKLDISYTSSDTTLSDWPQHPSMDCSNGIDFEKYCSQLLNLNGFVNIKTTPVSGDQGVDILAEKDGIKYAIQCKCYSSDLGNTPVQEVSAGKQFYHCHVGVVMTNQHFTKGARELAESTGVLLWDREKLLSMIHQ